MDTYEYMTRGYGFAQPSDGEDALPRRKHKQRDVRLNAQGKAGQPWEDVNPSFGVGRNKRQGLPREPWAPERKDTP